MSNIDVARKQAVALAYWQLRQTRAPFPLIGDVRMSHDEWHCESPTAKCGMSCHWYAEEKRQGSA